MSGHPGRTTGGLPDPPGNKTVGGVGTSFTPEYCEGTNRKQARYYECTSKTERGRSSLTGSRRERGTKEGAPFEWFGRAPPVRTRTATARACATCAAKRGPAWLSNLLSRCRRRRRLNRTCCTTCVPPSPGLMWTRHAVSSLGWELCCPRMIHRHPLMPVPPQ